MSPEVEQEPPGDPIAYYFRDVLLIGQPEATRLYLIRHAQSASNTGETTDEADPQITEVGREQARRLAERLGRQGVDAVYSSPFRRARQTAEVIAEAAGLPVTVVDDLREVYLGPRPDLDAIASGALADVKEQILRQARWDAFPGGEGSEPARRRISAAIDRIIAECGGKRVAVVAHAGVIQTYVSVVLGLPQDFIFYPFNASITSIRALGDKRIIWRLNDVAHLDGLPAGFGGIS
ncbi:MAG: histidine phosphatase family protein [Chloroflexi bacterium]|nr:histidine phosphatase family protein [Chloroflexota bacterium]